MTGVYSGGLVYEYSEEGNEYGLVTISGSSVSTNDDFTNLKTELANNPAPSGNGGYSTNNTVSPCPPSSDTFQLSESGFTGEELPAIPSGAVKYMSQGAGTGPGLTGDGSQNAGGESSGTATPGSGTATSTASHASSTAASTSGSSSKSSSSSSSSSAATSKGAASSLIIKGEFSMVPYIFTGVVAISTLLGAALL